MEPRHYRKRERHSSPRTQRAAQPKAASSSRNVTETAEVSPPGIRQSQAWSGYSQAEASISSAGGVMGEDDYSSSDTEVGDETNIHDTPFTGVDSARGEIGHAGNIPSRETHLQENASDDLTNQEASPFDHHNAHNLRSQSTSGSVSTLIDKETYRHRPAGGEHIPTGFNLKERLGEAIGGVTRNRSTSEWNIEPPMILDSTPLPLSAQLGSIRLPSTLNERNPAVLALTALCLSRQHLVHLTCLLSLILIVHAVSSRSTDIAHLKHDPSSDGKDVTMGGARWIKRSEWKRSWAIISFSFAVTGFFVVVKTIADMLGLSQGYDLTYADIIIATLFFQFSLYVCVRLARRGFTLGELGVVCHAATGLFMETVNLTRTRLALIPGSLLTGFLLSPLLVLSRKIAQRPAHRLRHPHEKELYRKALALGFYIGAAATCGGLIGFWVKWLLGWRDPWVWVALWLTEGRHWWSRPILIAYWGVLAAISVGGWTRQLNRARKRRAWSEVTNANGHSKISIHNSTAQAALGTRQDPRKSGAVTDPGFGQVATQMMDAANQKLPVLSINARRKFFHALATVMFIPGIAIDPAFTHLAFSLAFAAFNFAEYIRYFALYPFGAAVHLFLNEFLDESKDGGTAILSHFYLLTGCASGVWLEGPKTILSIFGALALGIGDALARTLLP
ncbi:hypothetical protein QFC22_000951 [Naganishia vaughanmartiniae]|uniref:Uncharacterized protein n=1 Tax=Naganishia vaughanmartiniae TaxID=1424756 RepID=A0ACC2XLB5_9TREE|nr:hypothetical protein QFC22_000951 [Naganishia vaughanmartiniae]